MEDEDDTSASTLQHADNPYWENTSDASAIDEMGTNLEHFIKN